MKTVAYVLICSFCAALILTANKEERDFEITNYTIKLDDSTNFEKLINNRINKIDSINNQSLKNHKYLKHEIKQLNK